MRTIYCTVHFWGQNKKLLKVIAVNDLSEVYSITINTQIPALWQCHFKVEMRQEHRILCLQFTRVSEKILSDKEMPQICWEKRDRGEGGGCLESYTTINTRVPTGPKLSVLSNFNSYTRIGDVGKLEAAGCTVQYSYVRVHCKILVCASTVCTHLNNYNYKFWWLTRWFGWLCRLVSGRNFKLTEYIDKIPFTVGLKN